MPQSGNMRSLFNTINSLATTIRRRLGRSKDRWEELSTEVALKQNAEARTYIGKGAKSFGLWALSDTSVAPLIDFIATRRIWPMIDDDERESDSSEDLKSKRLTIAVDFRLLVLGLVLDLVSVGYGVYAGLSSGAIRLIGWPVILARAAGLGTLLYTSLLIFSMTKYAVSFFLFKFKHIRKLTYMKLHKFASIRLTIHSGIHTIIHLARTFPKLLEHGKDEWNAVIRCARHNFRPVTFLEFPSCPLEEDLTVPSVLTSTVVISGFVLIALLGFFALSGIRKFRDAHHALFRATHNLLLVAWVFALYFHGASQFFGSGIPLVVPVCGVFILTYIVDKCIRFSARIVRVELETDKVFTITVRLDARHLPVNAEYGTFVSLQFPEISRLGFHPFSVVAVAGNELKLTISVRGKWTRKLSDLLRRRKSFDGEIEDLKCNVRGPFISPVFSMQNVDQGGILVVVAAGVGITAFLGSLSTVMRKSQVTYIYWSVRDASEVAHAQSTLATVCSDRKCRLTVFVTRKVDTDKDDPAFFLSETIKKTGGSLRVNLPGKSRPILNLKLGRPHWKNEFSAIKESGTRWVFMCAGKSVAKDVNRACDSCMETHGHLFAVTAEEF